MKYFDDMLDKYGFGDGGAVPPDAWACRDIYIAALNALAAHNGSAVRAVPFNRAGMHNSCLILFVSAKDAARLASGDEELAQVTPDSGMASAIDQANVLDLDDFVVITAHVTQSAADLVASLRGDGVSIVPDADGLLTVSANDPATGCPCCGGALGEIDVLPGLAIVSYVEPDGKIVWAGDTEIDWDSQRAEHTPARFLCTACNRVYVLDASTFQFVEVEGAWERIAGAAAKRWAAAKGWFASARRTLLAPLRGRET